MRMKFHITSYNRWEDGYWSLTGDKLWKCMTERMDDEVNDFWWNTNKTGLIQQLCCFPTDQLFAMSTHSIAGIYCERPTWNPDSYVTRMDRRIPTRNWLNGFSSSEVRHSPIKIRSLSTPPLETLCAYHQCQNKATCVENQGDVYQCLCNPGKTIFHA